jgi:HEPN domain-containing protein
MTPPPNNRRSTPGSPEDWLEHAQSDLNLARLAQSRDDILPEQACFHAQQAAEKALKAVLLYRKIEFPLVHDLEELIEVAGQGGVKIPTHLDNAGSLSPYAQTS